ncbi:MAG: adenylosuccinate synthetase [Gammaproteobacteria bacterium]|nr:adenylosuccinate synthetase [Gammaproteobacteria bacterium]
MKASVVVGANFGDCGKGLVTNWLSDDDTTVIRFNGGAQAGHTVQSEDGHRHVFSHIGAGSFKGAKTWLGEEFVINPVIFRKEMDEYSKLPFGKPDIWYDYRCRFTTPWDMVINQELEMKRADSRHGSVGLGFGETIERYEQLGLTLAIDKVQECKDDFVKFMVDKWVPARAKDLGIESRIDYIQDTFSNKRFVDKYFEDIDFFLQNAKSSGVRNPTNDLTFMVGKRSKNIVFEGAQGLLLDQHYGKFPHVTRSNTGLMNIDKLAKLNHITSLNMYYVTRCYLTRHGAGPLENELDQAPVEHFSDKTNRPNPFQGSLRFAPLNLNKLRERIDRDLRFSNLTKQLNLVITCMDQIGDDNRIPVIINGEIQELLNYELMGELMCFFPEFNLMICSDPTGKTIRDWFS